MALEASTPPPEDPERRGADHEKLYGARRQFWFRPDRLTREDFGSELVCRVKLSDAQPADYEVLDLAQWGFALRCDPGHAPMPGMELEEISILQRGEAVWTGRGNVVRYEERPVPRVGVRITSQGIDLDSLRVRQNVIETGLSGALQQYQELQELPQAWRAEVGMLQQLLQLIRDTADATTGMVAREGWWKEQERSQALSQSLYERWGPLFRERCLKLERISKRLTPRQMELGHRYAQRALMPLLLSCPMHRRAFEKPLGYAGDYRLMELIQEPMLEGESLFGRLMHHAGRHYTLAETVRRRGQVAEAAVREYLKLPRAVRIGSLACGPALELQRVLTDIPPRKHPVELLLIDQDEDALRTCQSALMRVINQRSDAALITVSCLRFSVRQIVLPKRGEEQQLVAKVLQGIDLIYSMGLYDYLLQPLARRVTTALWNLLAPGGKVLVGNLKRVPDSSWMMEYATEWNLIYRKEDEMLDLIAEAQPAPARVRIRRDKTGMCLFLEATRAASGA